MRCKVVLIVGGLLVAIGILIISVMALIGIGYLTQFAFNAKKENDKHCIQITDTQKNVIRISIVIIWIALALIMLSSLVNLILGLRDCDMFR